MRLSETMWFSSEVACFLMALTHLVIGGAEALSLSKFDIDSQADAEQLMDYVFANLANKTIPITGFYIKIKKDLFWGFLMTHRDINADFDPGQITGLESIKTKSCRVPTHVDGKQITVSCILDLNGVVATHGSTVTGFNLIGTDRRAVIEVHFRGTEYGIDITKFDEGHPSITKLVLERFVTEVRSPDFGFNEKRDRRLKEKIDEEVRSRVIDAINNVLLADINTILRNLPERRR